MSQTSLYEIMSVYLGMKKVCTRWIPKRLTPLQHANRVDCCEELLENCNQDPTGFFGRIMTGDDTQWTEKGGQEQFSDAESILSQRYVHHIGPSEI